MLELASKKKLHSGVEIPLFGLGVFRLSDDKSGVEAIQHALHVGYRHIDTASVYGNEETVGEALRSSDVPREEIFVTTKAWLDEQGREQTPKALQASLDRLGLDYIDLYLIHWPKDDVMKGCWEAMQQLRDEGRIRAIGVSNFSIKRLDYFFSLTDEVPDVNQVEFHTFNYKKDLLEECRNRGIALQAYSPLARTQKLDDPRLKKLAANYGKSTAQLMLRWCLQHDVITIPKSQNPRRIEENADIFDFEISAEDMRHMDALDEGYECSGWRPYSGFY